MTASAPPAGLATAEQTPPEAAASTHAEPSRRWNVGPLATARAVWDHVPITLLGAALLGLGLWAFFGFAEDASDHVVHAASIVGVVAVGLSVVTVGLFALYLAVRADRDDSGVPESVTTGQTFATRYRCPSFRYWPIVQVELDWAEPDVRVEVDYDADERRLVESVTATGRGRYERIVRRFIVRDIFGFAQIRFKRTYAQPFVVLPARGTAAVQIEIRRATSEGYSHPSGEPVGELVEMRRYVHGDSMRHIIWKAFAKGRRLMVRDRERAIAPRPAMIAFFVAAERDEASASTARLFLEDGLLGQDFVFMAEGARRPTPDPAQAVEQVIDARHHRITQADGIRALFRAVDRARLDNLVVFAPATVGPWIDKLLTAARALPLPPMVIVTVDGDVDPTRRRGPLSRFFFADGRPANPDAQDLPEVWDRLRSGGVDVRVIHRPSGRRIEAAQIEGLRELPV